MVVLTNGYIIKNQLLTIPLHCILYLENVKYEFKKNISKGTQLLQITFLMITTRTVATPRHVVATEFVVLSSTRTFRLIRAITRQTKRWSSTTDIYRLSIIASYLIVKLISQHLPALAI